VAQHQRFPLLDLARFFAALSVMAFHYGFHGGVTHLYLDAYLPAVGRYAKYGYLGLDAFFVLSGLVIAWSARGASAQTFAWRRWLRIYPTFVFAVGVTSLIVWLAADPRFTVSWPRMMAHLIVDARRLGFRFIDGAYWSIVAELFFYAMVTVGLAIPALRRHATLCLWAWCRPTSCSAGTAGSSSPG
jgi:peptidoglycan/LPS O-acetylase OafA/YrhL